MIASTNRVTTPKEAIRAKALVNRKLAYTQANADAGRRPQTPRHHPTEVQSLARRKTQENCRAEDQLKTRAWSHLLIDSLDFTAFVNKPRITVGIF